ncbi:hypothetical protein [Thermocatellispora tengchongensis]|uniref:hypothetical protein n=1 Tax=Thermocatellispora tengchongensis TaxID=1073253 RepID=UPI00362A6168
MTVTGTDVRQIVETLRRAGTEKIAALAARVDRTQEFSPSCGPCCASWACPRWRSPRRTAASAART